MADMLSLLSFLAEGMSDVTQNSLSLPLKMDIILCFISQSSAYTLKQQRQELSAITVNKLC